MHEVTSPQAFESLRLAGRKVRRPDRTLATADHNVPTDGSTAAAQIRDHLSRVQVETLERNCREFGVPVYSIGSERQGIVHVIGPELGVTQPGHDDRLRRLAHVHARRLRRARVRDRHERGRARARHADAPAAEAALDGDPLRGRARVRRHREGPDPRHDRPDRHGRRRRARDRVRRARDREALDGGPDDDLQHDDRGRRPRGHDRAGRHHVRVGRRPRRRAGRGARASGATCTPTTARRSTRRSSSTPARCRRRSPGARRRAWSCRSRRPCPSRRPRATSARSSTWTSSPARRSRTSGSTASSSARARTRGSATCAPRPRCSTAARCTRTSHAMVVPGSQQVKAQAEEEGLDDVFRAAGFDWRSAGCSMCLGMNPDILAARRALRVDLEPQLRGPPGPRRPHAPRQPADGRRGRDRGPLRRHQELELMEPVERHQRSGVGARPRRRRHRPDHPQAVPEARRADRLRRVPLPRLEGGAGLGPAGEPDPRHRAATSAAAPRASTRRGRSRTTASRRSSRRRSPTSSTPTARRSGCCRSSCRRTR